MREGDGCLIKVSVIVPVYNVRKYLDKCLKSLVNQTLKNIEIIIIDDGSTDGSTEIAQYYKKCFPDKIIYKKKKNGGLSSARNYGINLANGEYIGFVDSDDFVERDMFNKMYRIARHKKKIVECDFVWEYSNKVKNDHVKRYTSIKDYLVRGRVEAWNKIYKTKWLKKTGVTFPDNLLYEDLNFFFKIVSHLNSINEVEITHDSFVHYCQHQGTITSAQSINIIQIIDSYEDVFNYFKDNDLFNEFKSELEYKFCRNLLCSFLIRSLRIKNHNNRKIVLDAFWHKINDTFPFWKKNKYIKYNNFVNLYLKAMNKWLYKLLYL